MQLTCWKNASESPNSGTNQAEERIIKPEDRLFENSQSEEEKKQRIRTMKHAYMM